MGLSQSFALQYTDTTGAANLTTAWAWFTSSAGAPTANSCVVYYSRPLNTLYLLNDAGTAAVGAAMGSGGALANSQCAVAVDATTTALVTGTSLKLTLAMTFKPAFAGAKTINMFAVNAAGMISGWQSRGTWTVPSAVPAVTADSVSPSSGTGLSQSFALQYSDTTGAANLSTAWVWFTPSTNGPTANSCVVYYSRPAQTLYLLNDAGTTWASAAMGSGGTLANSQCAVAMDGTTTATVSGTTLRLTLGMSFTPAFAGTKMIHLFATNSAVTSGWQSPGTWTVPSGETR
jgi:hypothetical protein